jgi:hypothetical protein
VALRTEFTFALPKGYVDEQGTLHRRGTMRLATAADEIEPLRDPRVRENEAYLTIIVLGRVVTQLGTIEQPGTWVIERLFAADLLYLQDLYGVLNFGTPEELAALEAGPPLEGAPAEPGAAGVP